MWECIESNGDGPKMRRMAVPGGWLYAEYYNTQVYPAFVPQPTISESAAYKEGYDAANREQGDKVKPSSQEELNHAFREGYRNALKTVMSGLSGEEKRFVQAEYERAGCDLPHPFIEQRGKVKPSDLALLLERAATALLDEGAVSWGGLVRDLRAAASMVER